MAQKTLQAKLRRQTRIRKKLHGTHEMPRLTVFRSNKYMYAQLIDDTVHKTLFGVSEKQLSAPEKQTKSERARLLGQELAKRAEKKKITKIVFDKGRYAYHGRIKALADGAREGGLQF
jgi:large subunit ribosomal protein L18